MKSRFYKSLEQASEFRTLFVLLVVLALRARRIIPTLRPHHLLIPAVITQIIIFSLAALHPDTLFITATIGNLIIVGIAIYPSTTKRSFKAHWVR